MMGWTCCYHPTLINQVYQQQSAKLIGYKLKEKEKKLLSIPLYPVPTPAQTRLFWILNTLDLITTIQGLKHPEIFEQNPLLGSDPSNFTLVLHKAILGPIVLDNINNEQLKVTNTLLVFAVANNMSIISKKNAW